MWTDSQITAGAAYDDLEEWRASEHGYYPAWVFEKEIEAERILKLEDPSPSPPVRGIV